MQEASSTAAVRACADALQRTSKGADMLASRIGAVLGDSATGADRELNAQLRRLAVAAHDASMALMVASSRR